MNCSCGQETRVIDSRAIGAIVRRRRICTACKARFSTFELRAETLNEVWRQMNAAKGAFVAMTKLMKGIDTE